MTEPRRPERRRFLRDALRACLAFAAAPAFAPLAGCERSPALARRAALFFDDVESARAVGAEYLGLHPDERDEERLVAGLAGDPEREARWEALAAGDPAALRAELLERHRADFAAERVLLLRGWVLSATELRLCALAALAV